jgi:hypothetical protein
VVEILDAAGEMQQLPTHLLIDQGVNDQYQAGPDHLYYQLRCEQLLYYRNKRYLYHQRALGFGE